MQKVEHIQHTFIKRGWQLSVAESCTGGALAAQLTRLPGCSHYFLGGIVAYSNYLKIKLLGVDESLINRLGAVSAEVVLEMAEGVRRLTDSDCSLAVSGIAGPHGGSVHKPVGTIWAAIVWKERPSHVWKMQLEGGREEIIRACVENMLYHLSQSL